MHARVAEFGRRTGLRIRRGNPWGFESPLSHQCQAASFVKCHRIAGSSNMMIRKLAVILFLGTLLATLFPPFCVAQYYGPGYYYYPPSTPPPYYYNPYVVPQGPLPLPPFYYRVAPNPYTFRKWNRENRYSDYQWLLRSPLDRESDLDYMLRTF
jgi:hypothetical protein